MDSHKNLLLDYVRTLYERQSGKAARAGVTQWAIIVGLVYVVWHFFEILSESKNIFDDKLSFFFVFCQVNLILMLFSLLISFSGFGPRNGRFDYRVRSGERVGVQLLLVILIFIGVPICSAYAVKGHSVGYEWGDFQQVVNFWFLVISLFLYLIGFASEFFKGSDERYPSYQSVFGRPPEVGRYFFLAVFVVLISIFVGNIISLFFGVMKNSGWSKMIILAFDMSLLGYGFYMAYRSNLADGSLVRLSKLERDIVVHDLDPAEIRERLQEDFLGYFVGEWVEKELAKIKEMQDLLNGVLERSDSVLKEIEAIDVSYKIEREGRVGAYTAEIEKALSNYRAVVLPLVNWLKGMGKKNAQYQDKFIGSILEVSLSNIEESFDQINRRVSDAKKSLELNISRVGVAS